METLTLLLLILGLLIASGTAAIFWRITEIRDLVREMRDAWMQ